MALIRIGFDLKTILAMPEQECRQYIDVFDESLKSGGERGDKTKGKKRLVRKKT